MDDALNESGRWFLRQLKALLAIPSPPGREERMAAAIRERLKELGYAPETDPAGNVTVRLPGRDPSAGGLVLAAHLDEIALVVTGIDADGSLQVTRSGQLWPYKIGETAVDIIGDGEPVPGIVSMGSGHGTEAASRVVSWSDVRVLTGLTPRQLAERGVRIGSSAVPAAGSRGPLLLGDAADPMIAAWTLDDRGGLCVLLRLLEKLNRGRVIPYRPTVVAFTVHEEGGCHGAKLLAHRERPEIFLAVDGCPVRPGMQVTVDDRPAIWSMDAKAQYDQRLVRSLLESGRAVGVECQTVILEGAYSDASSVYDVGAAPRVGIIGHPRHNSHGFECARLGVFENVARVLEQFVQQEIPA
jgi:putative aminopeptidase FrvX